MLVDELCSRIWDNPQLQDFSDSPTKLLFEFVIRRAVEDAVSKLDQSLELESAYTIVLPIVSSIVQTFAGILEASYVNNNGPITITIEGRTFKIRD